MPIVHQGGEIAKKNSIKRTAWFYDFKTDSIEQLLDVGQTLCSWELFFQSDSSLFTAREACTLTQNSPKNVNFVFGGANCVEIFRFRRSNLATSTQPCAACSRWSNPPTVGRFKNIDLAQTCACAIGSEREARERSKLVQFSDSHHARWSEFKFPIIIIINARFFQILLSESEIPPKTVHFLVVQPARANLFGQELPPSRNKS